MAGRTCDPGRGSGIAACLAALLLATTTPSAGETLRQTLANAYRNNPRLDAERARLRATDEEVPRAQAGYRPRITGEADTGHQRTSLRPDQGTNGTSNPWGYGVNFTQPIFRGFRTVSAVSEAEANVRAGREQLRNVEQQVLLDAATAYCDVVRDQAIVRLREHNVRVLSQELAATETRRSVKEVTRTDVAQARARRAKAISQLDLAKANLKASRANYERVVRLPPRSLTPPSPPKKNLPRSLDEALGIGERESPNIVSALYREQAARFTIDRIRGELLPEVRLEGSYSKRYDPSTSTSEQDVGQITGRVSIPLYEGGETYARVRQAKHTHVSRLQEIEQARSEVQASVAQAWSRYGAARAQLRSDLVQVEANRIALMGVREEERVGQRTLLDVLNAEQELLDAQVQLSTTRRDLVVAAYGVLAQVGRLSVTDLGLTDEAYDPEAHYEEVRNKWFGLDITRPGGRTERVDVTLDSDPEWIIDK